VTAGFGGVLHFPLLNFFSALHYLLQALLFCFLLFFACFF
jgi:hypothetical protein